MEDITEFVGKHRFLSNFWSTVVTLDGVNYPSVEHAYQAAKTLDLEEREKILNCESASKAKKVGKTVLLRSDWEEIKLLVMSDLVTQKFTNHSYLKERLLETGNARLYEGNWWKDTFWGVSPPPRYVYIGEKRVRRKGKGKNKLGRILMKVRSELA